MAIYVNPGQAKTFICRQCKCWVGMGSEGQEDLGSICPEGCARYGGPRCVIMPQPPKREKAAEESDT